MKKKKLPKFIDWFRNTSAYINAHRNRTFVILVTGEALAHANFANIVYDINVLHSLGVKLVLVHGARPQISAALAEAGIESRYHHDLRVTDPASLPVIKSVVGRLSIEVEAQLSMGLVNSPMHNADIQFCRGNFVIARPVGVRDGVDLLNTGLVRKIQAQAIEQQLNQRNLVLLDNLGYSATGEIFNLSAEAVATEAAIALKADKLILLVPSAGVLDNEGDLMPSLTSAEARQYLNGNGVRTTDDQLCTQLALQSAIHASEHGVPRTHLISYRTNGALLQELFTREGKGTLVTREPAEQLRSATIDDVGGILELIKPLEDDGTLVHRSRELLEMEIGNFKVITYEGMIIGCAALYPMEGHSGEIACIATHPSYQKEGRGDRLLSSLEAEARKFGLKRVFILTTVATHWFMERGFKPGSVSDLPERRKQMYNFQRNSKVFVKAV